MKTVNTEKETMQIKENKWDPKNKKIKQKTKKINEK